MRKSFEKGFLGVLVGALLLLALIPFIQGQHSTNAFGMSPVYHSQVCLYKNNVLMGCHHNTVTNVGLNLIKDDLLNGNANKLDKLALGNGSAPVVTDTSLPDLITTNGLSMSVVDGSKDNGVGNFSVWKTWTATGEQTVTSAGIYADDGTSFFGGTAFPTSTTLEPNDKITVNYTIWVSNQ